MPQFPITFAFFTSSKGHWGRHTDWRLTLNHWDKQIPLTLFNLVAHLKVSPGQEALGDQMEEELKARGFHVIKTVGGWVRGLSHGAAYLGDMCKVSRDDTTYKAPYFMLVEDDSIALSHKIPLSDLLLQSCKRLAENRELLTVRLIRRGDYEGGVPQIKGDSDTFYSPNTDFQPLIIRNHHFDLLCQWLEKNPQTCEQTHCEQLWRLVLDNFSRSPHKHLVYRPDMAETVHLGVPDPEYSQIVTKFNLK